MAGSDADPTVPEVRGVSQGGCQQLSAHGEVQYLSSIYVPPAAESVFASIQQQSGRDNILQVGPLPHALHSRSFESYLYISGMFSTKRT